MGIARKPWIAESSRQIIDICKAYQQLTLWLWECICKKKLLPACVFISYFDDDVHNGLKLQMPKNKRPWTYEDFKSLPKAAHHSECASYAAQIIILKWKINQIPVFKTDFELLEHFRIVIDRFNHNIIPVKLLFVT